MPGGKVWRAMASGRPRGEGTGISSVGATGLTQLPSSPHASTTSWPPSWKARAMRCARDHGPPICERATMGTTKTFTIQGYADNQQERIPSLIPVKMLDLICINTGIGRQILLNTTYKPTLPQTIHFTGGRAPFQPTLEI